MKANAHRRRLVGAGHAAPQQLWTATMGAHTAKASSPSPASGEEREEVREGRGTVVEWARSGGNEENQKSTVGLLASKSRI